MNRKAVSGHEMGEIPNFSVTARLIDRDPVTTQQSSKRNSRFRDALRHVRLPLLGTIAGRCFAWKSTVEQRKVAAYRSRTMAGLNTLLHVIPLGGSITLLTFHWTRFWVGGSGNNATTLQFVAKLHELLMQASLVDLLLSVVRHQVLQGFVPLGVLSGAARAPQISYLWSLDFISAIGCPEFDLWCKTVFVVSATSLLFMTAVVGPASAVLMIPQSGLPHLDLAETFYLNLTVDTVFPTHIDQGRGLDFDHFQELQEAFVRSRTLDRGDRVVTSLSWFSITTTYNRVLIYSQPLNISQLDLESEFAVATIPTNLTANLLASYLESHDPGMDSRDSPSTNSSWSIEALEPVVTATCSEVVLKNDTVFYRLKDHSLSPLASTNDIYETAFNSGGRIYEANVQGIWVYPPLWIPAPNDPRSLVGLFPFSSSENSNESGHVNACAISAFWRRGEARLSIAWDMNDVKTVLPVTGGPAASDDLRSITIDPNGMDSLHSVGFAKNVSEAFGTLIGYNFADIVAVMFAAALAQIPTLDGRTFEFPSYENGYRRQSDLADLADTAALPAFTFTKTTYGFGYGSTDRAYLLSVAVMFAYSVITTLYITYTLITGHTSVAWNSATELIALALQSKEPDHLGHVSVGLDTMETFRKSVGVRVNTVRIEDTGELRERLELVFEHDADAEKRGLTKVVRNRVY